MDYITKIGDWAIDFANKGGALSASAILFLGNAVQYFQSYKRTKAEEEATLKRLEAWLAGSKAEDNQTAVIGKMADRIEMNTTAINAMASQVATMVALVKDRRGLS